jgi:hypothetical protein
MRFQRPIGNKRGEQRQIRREAVFGLRCKIGKAVDPRVGVLGKVAETQRGRLARGDAKTPNIAAHADPTISIWHFGQVKSGPDQ